MGYFYSLKGEFTYDELTDEQEYRLKNFLTSGNLERKFNTPNDELIIVHSKVTKTNMSVEDGYTKHASMISQELAEALLFLFRIGATNIHLNFLLIGEEGERSTFRVEGRKIVEDRLPGIFG